MSLRCFEDQRTVFITDDVRPYDYLIFKSGDMYYAKNGITNQIEFSGRDATTVIQQVLNSLKEGGLVFIKRGIYPIRETINVPSYVTLIGEGLNWGSINHKTFVTAPLNYGTILRATTPLAQGIKIDNRVNVKIMDISLDGPLDVALYMNAGGNNFVRISIIGSGNLSTKSNIGTGLYLEGYSGGWNVFEGICYGVNRAIYTDMDWSYIRNFNIAYPFEIGVEKGPTPVHVLLETVRVVDEHTSYPYVTAIGFYIRNARHITLIKCVSELYNPNSYHLKYSTYSPIYVSDVVSLYDCLFVGGAKTDYARLAFYDHGVPILVPNQSLYIRKGSNPSVSGLFVKIDEGDHITFYHPFRSDTPTLKFDRWASEPFVFSKGILIYYGEQKAGLLSDGRLFIKQKGVNVAVSEGSTSLTVTLPVTEPNTSYGVLVIPQWNTNVWVTNKTTTSFTINFGTAAPTGGSYIDWFVYR
jgi:hypothetical protein